MRLSLCDCMRMSLFPGNKAVDKKSPLINQAHDDGLSVVICCVSWAGARRRAE